MAQQHSEFTEDSNIVALQRELMKIFKGLRDGTADIKQAVEMNNTSGKIINIAKAQLAYHALRGEAPNIPFLAASVDKPGYLLPADVKKLISDPAPH